MPNKGEIEPKSLGVIAGVPFASGVRGVRPHGQSAGFQRDGMCHRKHRREIPVASRTLFLFKQSNRIRSRDFNSF